MDLNFLWCIFKYCNSYWAFTNGIPACGRTGNRQEPTLRLVMVNGNVWKKRSATSVLRRRVQLYVTYATVYITSD